MFDVGMSKHLNLCQEQDAMYRNRKIVIDKAKIRKKTSNVVEIKEKDNMHKNCSAAKT